MFIIIIISSSIIIDIIIIRPWAAESQPWVKASYPRAEIWLPRDILKEMQGRGAQTGRDAEALAAASRRSGQLW